MKNVKMTFLFIAVLLVTGCSTSRPRPIPPDPVPVPVPVPDDGSTVKRARNIKDVSCIAVSYGLQQLSKKDKVKADQIASFLEHHITEVVMPYLNEQEGVSSIAVNLALEQKFFEKLPDDIRDLIRLAAAVLDQYVPAPTAETLLTKEYVLYLQAFFSGVALGADRYAIGQPSQVKPKYSSTVRTKGWFVKPTK